MRNWRSTIELALPLSQKLKKQKLMVMHFWKVHHILIYPIAHNRGWSYFLNMYSCKNLSQKPRCLCVLCVMHNNSRILLIRNVVFFPSFIFQMLNWFSKKRGRENLNLNLNLFLFYNGYKLGRMPLFIWPLIQNYNLSTTKNIWITINFSTMPANTINSSINLNTKYMQYYLTS